MIQAVTFKVFHLSHWKVNEGMGGLCARMRTSEWTLVSVYKLILAYMYIVKYCVNTLKNYLTKCVYIS